MLHNETPRTCSYRCFIFDLDGTLLNTLEDLTDSVNYALASCGHPLRTMEEIRSFIGNGVPTLIRRSAPNGTSKEDLEHCLRITHEHYQVHYQDKTRPYEGILELLTYLKSLRIKTAVVSNKTEAAAKVLCETYFPNLIDLCIGDTKERRKKPAPDGVLEALHLLESPKESTLYIGDTDVDVDTAKNVGLSCAGVTWGFRNREFLETYGADYLIDTPMELKAYL